MLLRPRDKKPLFYHWQRLLTTDETKIRMWYGMEPNANVGIATGIRSGLLVLDVDGRNGGEQALPELLSTLRLSRSGLSVRTGSGGLHLYYKHPGTHFVASHTGKVGLAPGIELKADGGHFVVAPPSIHPNGNAYVWL